MDTASTNAQAQLRGCLNCGAVLPGEYCGRCGQKEPLPDPTLRELLHDTVSELTSWDGKLLSTMKTLITRPGRLTIDFLAGRRARWLPPLRLYLICSIGYFLLVPGVDALSGTGARSSAKITIGDSAVWDGAGEKPARHLTAEETAQLERSFLGRLIGRERLDRVVQDPQAFSRFFMESMPKAMFLLLPVLAFLINIAYRRNGSRYPRHLYFALHVHALAFVVLTAAILLQLARLEWLTEGAKLAALVFIIWYTVAAMRAVYGGSRGATVAKALAVGAVYLVCFGVVGATTAIISLALY